MKKKKTNLTNSKELRSNSSHDKTISNPVKAGSHVRYKFIDITTSDTAFIAYGRSLSELFENAALAMFEVMIDIKKIKQTQKRSVNVTGHDLPALMFNWLNELLVYVDSESLAFSKFNVKVDGLKLTAVCKGERIDQKKHELGTVVKSCTYHKMEIKQISKPLRGSHISKPSKDSSYDKIWMAQVILDI
ncbi:MAG: archease [Bacillota bacterium]